MRYLYVDNFRGFTNTVVQLKDVNFFVGENSTGKTSLMALIKLLSSQQFWMTQEFNSEDVELGNFKDIVSVNARDQSYFRVGVIQDVRPGTGKNAGGLNGFLMTFVEKEGMPLISNYTYLLHGQVVKFRFAMKKVAYKMQQPPVIVNESQSIRDAFCGWIEGPKDESEGYEEIKSMSSEYKRALQYYPIFLRLSRKDDDTDGGDSDTVAPIVNNMVWLAPIRTKPKRTYDNYKLEFSPDGTHTPYLIKRLLAEQKSQGKFQTFARKFGKDSGLFRSLSVKNYGQDITSPFELDVQLTNKTLHLGNVGYGVSQSLPVVVEVFARPKGTYFALQQPEVHLHPRAQAALGDVFFELAVKDDKKFIIETHSDFMINNFRLNYRRKDIEKKPEAQIVFFERGSDGNLLHQIEVLENGELPDTQPAAYRDFFVREQMRMLGL